MIKLRKNENSLKFTKIKKLIHKIFGIMATYKNLLSGVEEFRSHEILGSRSALEVNLFSIYIFLKERKFFLQHFKNFLK